MSPEFGVLVTSLFHKLVLEGSGNAHFVCKSPENNWQTNFPSGFLLRESADGKHGSSSLQLCLRCSGTEEADCAEVNGDGAQIYRNNADWPLQVGKRKWTIQENVAKDKPS